MRHLQHLFVLLAAATAALAAEPVPPAPGRAPADKLSTNQPWGAAYSASAPGVTNKSPVALFRELLAMKPAEREKALADKTEEQRRSYLGKLAEYQALSPTERELRFRATELRWYMLPLMRMSPQERTSHLTSVPADYVRLVEARLRQWDGLSAELRADLLENELTILYFLRLEGATRAQQDSIFASMPQAKREQLEANLVAFRAMSDDRRKNMLGQFNRFFDLSEREKGRILAEVPGEARVQTQKNLLALEKLSPEARLQCVQSYSKFVAMTPEQQAVFIKNAELWQKMSDAERQLWRQLASEVPPLPPGLDEPPMPPNDPLDILATPKIHRYVPTVGGTGNR